ncbi:endomucin isoform X1 [Colius striatus]|uniref:endomucin isoform X1 n=1 Tax=Colius striatus TaxID=57412 RepID=UPI002B1E7FE1|nr:endomucin isoform X1 [Colius striatus]
MKLLRIAFFLAVLCVCIMGEDDIPISTQSAAISASTSKSVTKAVNSSTLQTTTLQVSVLSTTAIRPTNESITSNSNFSSPHTTQQTTQGTTPQPSTVKVTTATADKNDSTTNATQESGMQLAQNGSSDASSTKGWSSSSTTSPQKPTSAPGTSDLHMTSPAELKTFGSPGSTSGSKKAPGSDIHYSSVILPIVITLIVITLSVFSLVALYRMCQKKTPERQENGTEQAQSDKEGVKLLSVKTTSPETVFVEVRDIYEVGFSLPSANLSEPTAPPPSGEVSQGRTTGENSSQGKNKTRQLFTSQQ